MYDLLCVRVMATRTHVENVKPVALHDDSIPPVPPLEHTSTIYVAFIYTLGVAVQPMGFR